jgi:hypothetical protein
LAILNTFCLYQTSSVICSFYRPVPFCLLVCFPVRFATIFLSNPWKLCSLSSWYRGALTVELEMVCDDLAKLAAFINDLLVRCLPAASRVGIVFSDQNSGSLMVKGGPRICRWSYSSCWSSNSRVLTPVSSGNHGDRRRC